MLAAAAIFFFEGDLRPGSSPSDVTFDNNVSLGSHANLEFELAGTEPGSEYDQIEVSGTLDLNGNLKVALIDGFAPMSGQSFDILDWGILNGTFGTLNLPQLDAGLRWNTSQLYTLGMLSVDEGLAGDFDQDGDVDGHDFLVWQRGNSPETLSANDLADWQSHYGAHGITAQTAVMESARLIVPEPSGTILATICGLILWFGKSIGIKTLTL